MRKIWKVLFVVAALAVPMTAYAYNELRADSCPLGDDCEGDCPCDCPCN